MNAIAHCKISVNRRKGEINDYLPIHSFMDSTKELCSDNRHRILHTMWGIRRVVIPIFGHSINNSSGKVVNVKDLCEQDHILPDYQNKFIPNLSDFVNAMNDIPDIEQMINRFDYKGKNSELMSLMLSPLAITGKMKSLILTHNSWFVNEILPRIFKTEKIIDNFSIAPDMIFNNMKFESWMDNGSSYPKSARLTFGKTIRVYDL